MRRYWPLLFLLASLWGASYLFIKVAVRDFPPAAMTDIRLLVAGVLLLAYLAATSGARESLAELREAWLPCLVLGLVNAALPMSLVAWGETHSTRASRRSRSRPSPSSSRSSGSASSHTSRWGPRGWPASRPGSAASRW